jgi:predicted HicB family RNase H-like nuclease
MDPRLTKVLVNIRVPWTYRNQLVEAAARKGVSLNQFLVDIIEAVEAPVEPLA